MICKKTIWIEEKKRNAQDKRIKQSDTLNYKSPVTWSRVLRALFSVLIF